MPDFTCGECGLAFPDPSAAFPEAGLCVACVCEPLWFRRLPDFRAHLAPDHDGVELVERQMPDLMETRG